MKFILLLLAVFVLLWMLRGSLQRHRPPPRPPQAPQAPQPQPQAMLQCAQCGLHLPLDESLPGKGGVFCGEAHRSAFEAAHRDP